MTILGTLYGMFRQSQNGTEATNKYAEKLKNNDEKVLGEINKLHLSELYDLQPRDDISDDSDSSSSGSNSDSDATCNSDEKELKSKLKDKKFPCCRVYSTILYSVSDTKKAIQKDPTRDFIKTIIDTAFTELFHLTKIQDLELKAPNFAGRIAVIIDPILESYGRKLLAIGMKTVHPDGSESGEYVSKATNTEAIKEKVENSSEMKEILKQSKIREEAQKKMVPRQMAVTTAAMIMIIYVFFKMVSAGCSLYDFYLKTFSD